MFPQGLVENGDLRVRRCRYGLMLYSLHDVYMGRAFEAYGEYGEQEVALYRQLIKPGQVVIDAGANIGSFTVYFGQAVGAGGEVHAFEPQRVIYHMLCANLALNRLHNVVSHWGAVGAAPGRITVPEVDYGKSDNFGGLSLSRDGAGEEVPVLTIDGLGLERCDFIKIDVQGMEGEVLTGAAETIARLQPLLYVENDLKENSEALIGQLFDLGYRLYWHIPRLFNPKNFFERTDNIYGNTVNINMMCLPAGDDRKVGLRQITSVTDWWKTAPPAEIDKNGNSETDHEPD